jgi:hypothetical protein
MFITPVFCHYLNIKNASLILPVALYGLKFGLLSETKNVKGGCLRTGYLLERLYLTVKKYQELSVYTIRTLPHTLLW